MAFEADPLEIAQVRNVRFALPDGFAPALIDPDRAAALDTISAALTALGARRVDAVVPAAEELYELFIPIQLAEAFDVHSRVLGTLPQPGRRLRRRCPRSAPTGRGCVDP